MNPEIDFQSSALMFLDFQVDVCDEEGRMVNKAPEVLDPFKQARQNAASLLKVARRSRNSPYIIHVRHVYEPGYPELEGKNISKMESYVRDSRAFLEGSRGAQIVDELLPLPGEKVIAKCSLSPYVTTDLTQWLTKRHINTVILAGVVTHYVILATAFASYDAGYSVFVVKDCCMAGTPETHNTALSILDPISTLVTGAEIEALISCI